MDKVSKLKEIIVELKMDLIRADIPTGYCPYTYFYYKPSAERELDCNTISCDKCRKIFMQDMEKDIRAEVEKL